MEPLLESDDEPCEEDDTIGSCVSVKDLKDLNMAMKLVFYQQRSH